MTDSRLIFLGRTGVGKSSFVNFLSGNNNCATDPYRPCTKDTEVVSVTYGEYSYDLIDAPGLCEAGEELDSLYLALVDKYLQDDSVFPNLVFKSDDSRLRSEDYQLLNTLIQRYGNRLFINETLVLTFAGNLPADYSHKILQRVRQITLAIYGIQIRHGYQIFCGFRSVSLVDSDLGEFFDITFPQDLIGEETLELFVQTNDSSMIAKKLDIHPEIAENIIATLPVPAHTGSKLPVSMHILRRLNRFPFHCIRSKDDIDSGSVPSITMLDDPKSVFDLANRLISDECSENHITINNGVLTYTATMGNRVFTSNERYADCLTVVAVAFPTDSKLIYRISFKVSGHPYDNEGKEDIDEIFKLVKIAEPTVDVFVKNYQEFLLCIKNYSTIFLRANQQFVNSVHADLADSDLWE